MMKKILALLLVLMMTLGTAYAQETTAVEGSEQTIMQMYINPQLMQMLGEVPAEAEQLVDTVVNLFNGMSWTVTEDEGVCKMVFSINESEVYDYTVAEGEDALHFFSSFFPNTAIKLDFVSLAELLVRVMENEEVSAMLTEAQMIANELIAALEPAMAALPAYMEDLEAVIEAVASGAQSDDAGTYMYMPVTTHHVQDLLLAWAKRLQNDTALLPVAELVVSVLSEGEMADLSAELASLIADLEIARTQEANELASFATFVEDDGSLTYEIALMNLLLISANVYEQDGTEGMNVIVVISEYGTDDWKATYDSVYSGEAVYDDMVLGISVTMSEAAAETVDYMKLFVVSAGSELSASAEITGVGRGTADWSETGVVSLDMESGDTEMNLGGFAWQRNLVEKLTAPSLEDKYVLDVLALPLDVLLNGLPEYVEKLEAAAPELVVLIESMMGEMLGVQGGGMSVGGGFDAGNDNTTNQAPQFEGGIEDM